MISIEAEGICGVDSALLFPEEEEDGEEEEEEEENVRSGEMVVDGEVVNDDSGNVYSEKQISHFFIITKMWECLPSSPVGVLSSSSFFCIGGGRGKCAGNPPNNCIPL
jgi:hypothetical protein